MRTATVRLDPGDGGLHPADAAIAAHPDVEREAIDQLTELDDGTGVLLSRLRGETGVVESALADVPDVLDVNVAAGSESVSVHLHFVATAPVDALLELRRRHELVIRTPMKWRSDGSLEVTAVGPDRTLTQAVDRIPDAIDVELMAIREYDPAADRVESLLTDRQREVLDAAMEVGYYDVPRQGTQADVAESVGLAPATAGEHLRRIECSVLRAFWE